MKDIDWQGRAVRAEVLLQEVADQMRLTAGALASMTDERRRYNLDTPQSVRDIMNHQAAKLREACDRIQVALDEIP